MTSTKDLCPEQTSPPTNEIPPQSPVHLDLRIGDSELSIDCDRILVVAGIGINHRVVGNMTPRDRAMIGTLLIREYQSQEQRKIIVPASTGPAGPV